jgi:hypothetical protein
MESVACDCPLEKTNVNGRHEIQWNTCSRSNFLTEEQIVLKMYDVGGFKFGGYTMRTGEVTPVYIDMRIVWSYPDLVVRIMLVFICINSRIYFILYVSRRIYDIACIYQLWAWA